MGRKEFNFVMQKRLEEIYSKYPRKLGKSPGFKTAVAQIKSLEDLTLLELSVDRYIQHLKREGVEKQFILYFSTFMHQWKDWLEDDVGEALEHECDLNGIDFE